MTRDIRLYVTDIIDAVDAITEYTSGVAKEAFTQNRLLQDAVIRRIEIIGEAVSHLPGEVRADHPDIPWRRIAGMRNRLVHEYYGVIIDRVWNAIERDLPLLKAKMQDIQAALE